MTPARLAELAARAVVLTYPDGPPPPPLRVVFAPDPVLLDVPAYAVALPDADARELHTAGADTVFRFAELVMPRVRIALGITDPAEGVIR
jgi:hypothetical protein